MVIDSSALIAILRAEPEAKAIVDAALKSTSALRMSAASFVEVGAVIDQARDPIASRRVDEIIAELGIQISPVTVEQAKFAREAYRDFGKGSGHRASLNFGDCFAYALAKEFREPILFKSDDFGHTDLEVIHIA